MDERKVKQAIRGLYAYNRLKRNNCRVDPIDKALNSLSPSDRNLIFRFYINRKRRAVWINRSIVSRRALLYEEAQRAFERYISAYCRKE